MTRMVQTVNTPSISGPSPTKELYGPMRSDPMACHDPCHVRTCHSERSHDIRRGQGMRPLLLYAIRNRRYFIEYTLHFLYVWNLFLFRCINQSHKLSFCVHFGQLASKKIPLFPIIVQFRNTIVMYKTKFHIYLFFPHSTAPFTTRASWQCLKTVFIHFALCFELQKPILYNHPFSMLFCHSSQIAREQLLLNFFLPLNEITFPALRQHVKV